MTKFSSLITDRGKALTFLLSALLLLAGFCPALAQDVKIRALVDRKEVYVGEPFTLQIQVEGDDSPAAPDLSGLTDFTVQPGGTSQQSSTSIELINGSYTQITNRVFLFNFTLTAKHSGRLVIPSLTAGGVNGTFQTRPLTITAKKPEENDDFKLRLKLSKNSAYVGEPLTLEVTLYVGRDCQELNFNIPLLLDPALTGAEAPIPSGIDQSRLLRLQVNGQDTLMIKGNGSLAGREFITVSFKRIIIPLKTGEFSWPGATVSCQVLQGYRHNNPFGDDFFGGFFGRTRQGVYRSMITPGNDLALAVRELPTAGRPPGFNGAIGQFSMVGKADPLKVRVGDPITLTLLITGPEYLDNIELPSLNNQPALAHDFKFPAEAAPGEVEGRAKVFTRTIRPRHSGITKIPPITFDYFNQETGRYEQIATQAIPLEVAETRTITAQDAQGSDPAPAPGNVLEEQRQGIAYNYEDTEILLGLAPAPGGQDLFSPLQRLLLIILPLSYLSLLTALLIRKKREANPARRRSRQAFGIFKKSVRELRQHRGSTQRTCEQLLTAIRMYLGDRYELPSAGLTFREAAGILTSRAVPTELLTELEELFSQCEGQRYGGHRVDPDALCLKAEKLIEKLEGELS